MSAATIRDSLVRLRDVGRLLRERSAADVHAVLADALDAWSAPASPFQTALAGALAPSSGFSPETLREGLARGLAPYTGAALHALVREELGGTERLDTTRGMRVDGFLSAATVLAGAIPLPTFVAIVAPLALRTPVLVKPALHDPVAATLFARSLVERDPLLGACVEIAAFHRDDAASLAALCEAECVVANGSDDAVAAVARSFAGAAASAGPSPRRFIGYGHRSSLAVLGPGATHHAALATTAAALALDVALWDQLGCLSPLAIHVVSAERSAAPRVAEALAEALAEAELRWPRGRIEAAAGAAIARARAEAEMRDVAVFASRGTEWSVVCEADAQRRSAPLHRFVRVQPSASIDACLAALRPQRAQLAAVALAGFGSATAEIGAALAELGASRICAPGTLQAPPLSWPRDNMRVLLPFVRYCEMESDERGA